MTNYTKIDNCLSTKNGHLFIEDCDTVELVKQFGSPLFVISESQLRQNVRSFHKAFVPHWPDGDVEVLPAIKANWILATRKILSEEGAGADVYSYGELHAALEANVNPEIISVNGGGKQEAQGRGHCPGHPFGYDLGTLSHCQPLPGGRTATQVGAQFLGDHGE